MLPYFQHTVVSVFSCVPDFGKQKKRKISKITAAAYTATPSRPVANNNNSRNPRNRLKTKE